jgi:hypothetical protein
MWDTLAEGDGCAGCGVKGFVAVRDACRAFQNDEILVLISIRCVWQIEAPRERASNTSFRARRRGREYKLFCDSP